MRWFGLDARPQNIAPRHAYIPDQTPYVFAATHALACLLLCSTDAFVKWSQSLASMPVNIKPFSFGIFLLGLTEDTWTGLVANAQKP
jgi:hypothetical protein